MPTRSSSPHAAARGRRRGWGRSARERLELSSGLVADIIDTGAPAGLLASTEPAVLLLHGIGMTSASLEPVATALAATHRAVCVTLPGYGGTPRPRHGLSIEDDAAVAAEIADRLHLRSLIVVGQSMGTQVGVELARSRPDLVAGLVLIGPVVDDRHSRAIDQAVALAIDSTRERPLANLIVLRDYLRCGLRWYLKTLPAMLGYSTIDRAAGVIAPTIVVRGAGDPIAGEEWVRRLAGAFPDARVATLSGAHHVQLVVPDDVAALIRALANDRSAAIRQGHARFGTSDHDGNTTTLERRSNA
ncbi:alpha/beta fold hydrolase [Labedella phragmitis]|uniref:Alpha/beta fold hydrolase n=1 Tax=Labedella phragmitis TaxID=2498849 RepID=A0A3S4DL85_9MICO|nr:alpha/beta fold hydrolase [Labedella phragmitis]RWZ51050.1 alpha/beta fold hydrolase [Labedella phragmitis]